MVLVWSNDPYFYNKMDGDQTTVKAVYTVEANEEIKNYLNSKAHYIGVNGVNGRVSNNEVIQVIYNLTKVKEGSKLTNPVF